MKRRAFITLIGGVAASWPLAARAQQPQMRRVGALILGNADAEAFQKELRDGLSKAGYIEERNVQFDIRSAQGRIDQLPKLPPNWWRQRLMSSSLSTRRACAPQSRRRAIFPSLQSSPTLSKRELSQAWRGRTGISQACR